MGAAEWSLIAVTAITLLFGVIGYLLQRKDQQQEKEIAVLRTSVKSETDELWTKHNEDAEKLRVLEIAVAANHPDRMELERRFDKLDAAFSVGIGVINGKIDKMLDNATVSANAAVAAAQAATTTAQAATAVAQSAAASDRRR